MEIINTKLFTVRNVLVIGVFAIVVLTVARKLLPHPAMSPPGGDSGPAYSAPDDVSNVLNMGDPDQILG